MAKKNYNRNSFYIENHSETLKKEMIAIAKNKGTTLTAFLRGLIIKCRDEAPEKDRVFNAD